jgi:hypothetical protein
MRGKTNRNRKQHQMLTRIRTDETELMWHSDSCQGTTFSRADWLP